MSRARRRVLVFFAILFIGAGLLHFVVPDVYLRMMPAYLPWHLELVLISGAFEILGGVGLLWPPTRRLSAWGLLALLLAVFPANVNMAIHGIGLGDLPPSPALLWARLPLQFVAMGALWWCALADPQGNRKVDFDGG